MISWSNAVIVPNECHSMGARSGNSSRFFDNSSSAASRACESTCVKSRTFCPNSAAVAGAVAMSRPNESTAFGLAITADREESPPPSEFVAIVSVLVVTTAHAKCNLDCPSWTRIVRRCQQHDTEVLCYGAAVRCSARGAAQR